jgi:hypothetical protein
MARFLRANLSGGFILDPSVGPGALLAACSREVSSLGSTFAFEIDRNVLGIGDESPSIFPSRLITKLRIEDFIHADVSERFDAIIANPPYLRHHRIPQRTKAMCQAISKEVIGTGLDARAGIQVFFLLKALSVLKSGGRLSFILPSDVVEGVFAQDLWKGISSRFRIRGALTFEDGACAFPGVDTNAFILFLEHSPPLESYSRLYWSGSDGDELREAIGSWEQGDSSTNQSLRVETRNVVRGVEQGLTRRGVNAAQEGIPFVDLARVVRGIATGDNSYFAFTSQRIEETGLSQEFFVRCIGRTRDLLSPRVDKRLLETLDRKGRETYLLTIDEETPKSRALSRYIKFGEERGVSDGALVRARSTWFAVERRTPPPILFTYLGRRDNRFVANPAGVVPLTGFLCVYPKRGVPTQQLLQSLNHQATWECIRDIGKSYGGGAVKVEPGNLRRLIIPKVALEASGLISR